MSRLALAQFNSLLAELIDAESLSGDVSYDNIVKQVLSKHRDKIGVIQEHILDRGLRALVRNCIRAVDRDNSTRPDLFRKHNVSGYLRVPFDDGEGKRTWVRRKSADLSFDDFDRLKAHHLEKARNARHPDLFFEEAGKKIEPYRAMGITVAEALKLAELEEN